MYRTPIADQTNVSELRACADIIEEVTDNVTYLGFCAPGTQNETDPTWSILKIEQSGIVQPITTRFKWANGLCSFNLKWSERATFNYLYKNF